MSVAGRQYGAGASVAVITPYAAQRDRVLHALGGVLGPRWWCRCTPGALPHHTVPGTHMGPQLQVHGPPVHCRIILYPVHTRGAGA